MTNMTAEKPTNIQDIRSESKGVITEALERRKEWFEKLTPPCPQDDTPSKFIEYTGNYTRVRGVFECQQGHRFYYG